MTTAIYALSADPIHFGHIDIIQRSIRTFDKVIVAIGINPKKTYTFPMHERRYLAEKCFTNKNGMIDPKIKVMSFSNLLVDFAYEQSADVIIKGVRNAADFDYENVSDIVSRSQKVGIDTHVLFSSSDLSHISSSVVKQIVSYNGNLLPYVPLHVKQALEEKLGSGQRGQKIIGITGEIGCGKSYIGELLTERAHSDIYNTEIHNIELDHIGHDILCKLEEPAYISLRKNIALAMEQNVLDENGFIKRDILGSIVFKNNKKLSILNSMMQKPLMVRLRQELTSQSGIILINCALLAEADMLHICNNNVILITVDKDTQKHRLMKRGLTEEQINRRLACQYTQEGKRTVIQTSIDTARHGNLWEIDNSQDIRTEYLYDRFKEIIW